MELEEGVFEIEFSTSEEERREKFKTLRKEVEKNQNTLRWDLLKRMKKRDLFFCLCRFCVVNSTLILFVHSLTFGLCLYVFIDSILSTVDEIPKIEFSTRFEDLNDFTFPALSICTQFPDYCDAFIHLNVSTATLKTTTSFSNLYPFEQIDHLGNRWRCNIANLMMEYKYTTLDVYVSLRMQVNVSSDHQHPPCAVVPTILLFINTTQFAETNGFSSLSDMLSSSFNSLLEYGIKAFGSQGTVLANDALNYVKYQERHYYKLETESWDTSYPHSSTTFPLNSKDCSSGDRCIFLTEAQVMRINPTDFYFEYLEGKWYSPILAVGGVIGYFSVLKVILDCCCSELTVCGQKICDNFLVKNFIKSEKYLRKRKKKKKNKRTKKMRVVPGYYFTEGKMKFRKKKERDQKDELKTEMSDADTALESDEDLKMNRKQKMQLKKSSSSSEEEEEEEADKDSDEDSDELKEMEDLSSSSVEFFD